MDEKKKAILEKLVSKIPSKWFEESEIRFNKRKNMKNNDTNKYKALARL